jgi:iron complex outermembrane receptor protein
LKLEYKDFKLFGYTLDASIEKRRNEFHTNPLTAKHRLNNVLMYEEEKWKIGLELLYSKQELNDNCGRLLDFWVMIENFGKFSGLYLISKTLQIQDKQNLEVFAGPLTNPVFRHLRFRWICS